MRDRVERWAAQVGAHALAHGERVAVAESLTGGALCTALATAENAGYWFAGGVVAYHASTKYAVLGVPEGPVVTAEAARQMARGVLDLTSAGVAVAVTGVGGPGDEEGHPAGTVFVCVASPTVSRRFEHHFDGGPQDVVAATVAHALEHLSMLQQDLAESSP